MNIEKVKSYNQRMLAILGTIVIIIAIFALISVAYFTITEISRDIDYREEGVLSENEVEKLQQENKRLQVISYDTPRLIDTLNLVYIIPIEHKTLNKAEEIDEDLNGLLNGFTSSSDKKSYYGKYSKSYYGSYNNLIVFDEKKNTTKTLIDQRLNFNEINSSYFEDDILILFLAADTDSNKDGVMNLQDFNSLFIYSLEEQKLRTVKIDNADVIGYQFIEGSKNLIIYYGTDHDKDGQFSSNKESSFVKKYDFEKETLDFIVDKETNIKLQKLLEGSFEK